MSAVNHDVLVIGAGAAGLAAARALVREGVSVGLVESLVFGGLITNVNALDGEISGNGAEFAANLASEAMDAGVESIPAMVSGIERDGDLLCVTSDAGRHTARAVIVASGARLRRLGVPGEAEFEHRGVSHCADCDGPMLARKAAVVVGGGDSALQEALVLAEFAERVFVVHRRDGFRAAQRFVDAVRVQPRIEVVPNTEVVAIEGDDGVRRVRTRRTDTGAAGEIACDGVFVYVGLEPACEFVPAAAARDARGALVTDAQMQTTVPGIHAAGAVRAGCGGTLRDAIDDGEAAARHVLQRIGAARGN